MHTHQKNKQEKVRCVSIALKWKHRCQKKKVVTFVANSYAHLAVLKWGDQELLQIKKLMISTKSKGKTQKAK